jgi:hypothetical protein
MTYLSQGLPHRGFLEPHFRARASYYSYTISATTYRVRNTLIADAGSSGP